MHPRKTTFSLGEDFIEITTPEGTPGDEREAEHYRFIVEHWSGLAAASYEGFRRFGVGALVLEPRPAVTRDVPHPFLGPRLFYGTSFGTWLPEAPASPTRQWIEEQVEGYDPRETVLLLFLHEGETPRAYRIEGTLRPAEALERFRAVMN